METITFIMNSKMEIFKQKRRIKEVERFIKEQSSIKFITFIPASELVEATELFSAFCRTDSVPKSKELFNKMNHKQWFMNCTPNDLQETIVLFGGITEIIWAKVSLEMSLSSLYNLWQSFDSKEITFIDEKNRAVHTIFNEEYDYQYFSSSW